MYSFVATIVAVNDPRLNNFREVEGNLLPPLGPNTVSIVEGQVVYAPGAPLTGSALQSALNYTDHVRKQIRWLGNTYLANKYGLQNAPELTEADEVTWEQTKAVFRYAYARAMQIIEEPLPELLAKQNKDGEQSENANGDLLSQLLSLPKNEREKLVSKLSNS